MPNMSYCMMRNTLNDLRDVSNRLEQAEDNIRVELSPDELNAFERLVKLCKQIGDDYVDEDGELML